MKECPYCHNISLVKSMDCACWCHKLPEGAVQYIKDLRLKIEGLEVEVEMLNSTPIFNIETMFL